MRVKLREVSRTEQLAVLSAALPPINEQVRLRYRTRTGALLRVDGVTLGAFDREHGDAIISPSRVNREITLEVELRSLPTNGLPSGPNIVWWFLNATANQKPKSVLGWETAADRNSGGHENGLALIGHSHLDVAWLWTYEQTARKARRTFAIACDLLDRDPAFTFIQSQPQLYAFVEENDAGLFGRIARHVRAQRLDCDVAALWVESDCNLPSGESLLRQMLAAHRYCTQRFDRAPQVAWLPDSFGFANTVPQLLAHAGIPYFATTKLQWNDTTRFPYPQFRWRGPDGSEVVSALIASYDGGPYPWRKRTARERKEPLVLGYGDGGGGVTAGMLRAARTLGHWIRPRAWFAQLEARKGTLPVHEAELYLEYHRGVYTTHHDIKAGNALLERALDEAEELLAWCVAVHAQRLAVRQGVERLRGVWEIALRNQFHDVLPGTSIERVYDDVRAEYDRAAQVVASVMTSAQAMLARSVSFRVEPKACRPHAFNGGAVLENAFLRARIDANGSIVELAAAGGPNVCSAANLPVLYRDRPKAWEAWNIDRAYARSGAQQRPQLCRIDAEACEFNFLLGSSTATMRLQLFEDERFLRADWTIDWRERKRLLRIENQLPMPCAEVVYGTPHGTVRRSTAAQTPQERARYEVPGQRFAFAAGDRDGEGLAILTLDTYGWSARRSAAGLQLGHSLLRGTTWPDPHADLGEQRFSYAFAPYRASSIGLLERLWLQFAHGSRVRLFTCEDASVLPVCCKPAESGEGVLVRVRECDGIGRRVRLRCGARMTGAQSVDALERAISRSVAIDGEDLTFDLNPYELRSFVVRFSHET